MREVENEPPSQTIRNAPGNLPPPVPAADTRGRDESRRDLLLVAFPTGAEPGGAEPGGAQMTTDPPRKRAAPGRRTTQLEKHTKHLLHLPEKRKAEFSVVAGAKVNRPGITPETVAAAKVRPVTAEEAEHLCGLPAAGLWIPYPGTKDYGRLRLETPTAGRKYHQKAGSAVHAYLTPSALEGPKGGGLALVEGEFKSLSLHESGLVTIGLSGFYGFQSGGELVSEVENFLRFRKPERILFFGDADTTLNAQFAGAAVKLRNLTGLPVFLPRIPLDKPKGIDDCREEMGEGFAAFLSGIVEDAIDVEEGMTGPQVAVEILLREFDRLKAGTFGMPKSKATRRLVEIGASMKSDPIAFEELSDLLNDAGITGKRAFSGAVKECRAERRRKMAEINGNPVPKCKNPSERFAFDGRRYFMHRKDRWLPMERQDLLLTVDSMGYPRIKDENASRSAAENLLLLIQSDRRVDYAGPLCGRKAGLFEEAGRKVLATTSPAFVEGEPGGKPGPLFDFFAGLFGKDSDDDWMLQMGLFMGWLKQGRRAIREPHIHLPGHLLGLIGAADCGKSLGQDLISLLLGGRSSDAATWLQGRTDFNSQLWGAEHLILSDANLEDDGRVKKAFRDALKGIVANPVYPLSKKYADELSLRPIWRISLSANDDQQSAGVIPSPIADPSLADKVLFLKCHPPLSPFHGNEPGDRLKFWESLIADLPNFAGMVDAFEVDSEWQKGRFGVMEWMHPDIVELLDASNPDREIIEYLSDWIDESTDDSEWSGRAKDLFEAIDQHSEGRFRKQACRNSTVLSHAMKRIAALPDWSSRIEIKHARFGPNRKKALKFTIHS